MFQPGAMHNLAMRRLSYRAVWCGCTEAGTTQESVAEYVERMHQAGINCIFVHLKGGDGSAYWKSDIFPDATAEGYEEFDLPGALLRECRKRGMRIEAWLIDFFEGRNGAAYRAHPDWAMANASGEATTSETLRGEPYSCLWMCPARRPGYTDQWLVPLYREFAQKYDFDAVHHDYVRYPGDLAPDQYCFCDYCLENMPRFNRFATDVHREKQFYHALYDRPYVESHWEQSPRVLPMNWDRLPRSMKSRFLLEGSFFQTGRNDLDYFFYSYRTHWITQFTRMAAEAVRSVRPGMEISAAVFKNPIHSGRFIAQDWRTFAPYVDGCIPMNYRDHYPGTFDEYLDLLRETITDQKEWARDFRRYWPGAAINFLFFEEELPLMAIQRALKEGRDYSMEYAKVASRLRACAPNVADALESGDGRTQFYAFMKAVPTCYWPKDKLVRLVEAISETGVDGMSLFCEGHLHQYGLWDTLTDLWGG